ncbi:T9SS type A sorting domain-containing protein [Neolewinella lacunae]|uniref:T9SS type A sorting domain-containing protein n=1 Tax=Neolewinella lacunae TaxID=1517758 RepID=A0A923T862_9BACT|nr:T9SS type A sorting domain-containing protein [Neolewinella lacunae]MBC6994241.1 T9SS type A sorting domain-containing protein [Neolewinella lacunae]MDN3637141.1 T9SS type A sorting domain-containing protein [Neolewinella lacunae]
MQLLSIFQRAVLLSAIVLFALGQATAASGKCSSDSNFKYTYSNGVATFYQSVDIGTKFLVPSCWKKIQLQKDVTITGSFLIPNSNTHSEFIVAGHSTTTQWSKNEWAKITTEIKGKGGVCYAQREDYATDAAFQNALKECRRESAIRYEGTGTLKVNRIKSRNPRKFHIWAAKKVIVDYCDLISTGLTTDGVHGQTNSKSEVRNSRIAVDDDALYVQEVSLVKNCTIYHRKNGSPFQVGWGSDFPNGQFCKIVDTKVIADYNGTDYNSGVVSWQRKDACEFRKMKLEFVNFAYQVPAGKTKIPNFFQFGGNYNNCNVGNISRVQNATIEVVGLNIANKCSEKAWVFNLNSNSSNKPVVRLTNCNSNLGLSYVSNNACLNGQVNSCGSSRPSWEEEREVTTAADLESTPLSIYPNPGNGHLNIAGGKDIPLRIEVYNLTGQRVLMAANTRAVDLTNLASGVYIIRIDEQAPLRYLKQ